MTSFCLLLLDELVHALLVAKIIVVVFILG